MKYECINCGRRILFSPYLQCWIHSDSDSGSFVCDRNEWESEKNCALPYLEGTVYTWDTHDISKKS
jgi:hypothetical protein